EIPGRRLDLEVIGEPGDPGPLTVRTDPAQFRKALSYLVWYLTHNSTDPARVSISAVRYSEKTGAEMARILVGSRTAQVAAPKPLYQIRTAASGRAALEEIPGFNPDLVILDIKMAEMDGLEALRRVKQLDPSIEVVMITAYASLDTVRQALTHGAFEYLIKPFSRQDLEDVVRRALVRRQADLGARSEVAHLVEEMRRLSAKTRELEEVARREV